MHVLFSTGQTARLTDRTEPQVADLVRRGKVDPPPLVIAGRRFWNADQVRQAAQHLGALTERVEAAITDTFGEKAAEVRP